LKLQGAYSRNLGRIAHAIKAIITATLVLSALSGTAQSGNYDEPFRPQVHFSPRQHWTNDPNGLVYFHGEYHLFFQYNPFGDTWGHMSWGHAVSTDMLHWHELPVALPEKDGMMIFTGSIVVDRKNSSGFCSPGTECLVAIYTGSREPPQVHRQTQNVAFSRDNGRTWTQFAGNPVLDLEMGDFRDPSVTWNQETRRWTMAVSLPKEHKILFFASADLKSWSQKSEFGPAGNVAGDWECPDLLRVPSLDGKSSIWALKVGLNPGAPQGGSGEQYFLGNFDGQSFKLSTETGSHGWTNYGKDDYCAISFNGLPAGHAPVLLGWMNNWQYANRLPTSPWRGQMSLPRELSFTKDEAGIALKQEPIVKPLRGESRSISVQSSTDLSGVKLGDETAPFELDLHFDKPSEQTFGVRLYSDERHWTEFGFNRQKGEFYMDRSQSGAAPSPYFPARTTAPLVTQRPYDLKIIVDRSSVEAYAQNGTIAMTDLIYPAGQNSRIQLFSLSGRAVSVQGRTWTLKSIWK